MSVRELLLDCATERYTRATVPPWPGEVWGLSNVFLGKGIGVSSTTPLRGGPSPMS